MHHVGMWSGACAPGAQDSRSRWSRRKGARLGHEESTHTTFFMRRNAYVDACSVAVIHTRLHSLNLIKSAITRKPTHNGSQTAFVSKPTIGGAAT